jgi:hypothetical protein
MRNTIRFRVAAQRLAAHLMPLACGIVLACLTLPILQLLPGNILADLRRSLANDEPHLLAITVFVLLFVALFLAGHIVGWWLAYRFVPWSIAERHLRGSSGNFTTLNRLIARWYGQK